MTVSPKRAKESGPAKVVRMVGCGNSHAGFGCGKHCRILETDKISGAVTAAEGYHSGVKLCLGCANAAAYNWGIPVDDLDFLMVAKIRAQAGKCGVPPTREEVWAVLQMLGVKPARSASKVEWSPTKPAALPVGDW